jgi:hypothetical protein
VVPDAARAQIARAGGLAAVVGSLAFAGCLGGSDGSGGTQNAGATFGTPIRLAECSDWRTATPSQRSAIIEGVKAVSGGPTGSPAGHGRVLDDDRAYNLFEVYCRPDFAKRFKLYKLYTRAAAFGGG